MRAACGAGVGMSASASPTAGGSVAPPSEGESTTCHTCNGAIATAQFIRVGAYKFHKDHFTCVVCSSSLHGKKFHHKEGKFVSQRRTTQSCKLACRCRQLLTDRCCDLSLRQYCANDYVDKFCHTCRHWFVASTQPHRTSAYRLVAHGSSHVARIM